MISNAGLMISNVGLITSNVGLMISNVGLITSNVCFCFPMPIGYTWWHSPWMWSTADWCHLKFCVLQCDWSSYRCESGTSGKDGCDGVLDWSAVWISYPGTGNILYMSFTHLTMHTFNHAHIQPCTHSTMHTFNHAHIQPCTHSCTQTQNKSVILLVVLMRIDWEKHSKMVCHNLSFPQ